METVKSLIRLFVALLPISAIAQGQSSALMPEKASGNFAALNKKALAGDTRSQLQLGIAFEFGQGVDKNFEETMQWYRIAADRGDPVCGPTNLPEAAKWYLRAATSGFIRAQFNLGTLYLRGAGVERNDEVAAHWITKAADAGCPTAMAALGHLYAHGVGVRHDEQKARELVQKASTKNDPRLCTRYGKAMNRSDTAR
jgi:hypothetical protein